MHTSEQALSAYAAAVQAAAANGARGLCAMEMDDPSVGAVQIECSADGSCVVTLLDKSAHPIGGYTL